MEDHVHSESCNHDHHEQDEIIKNADMIAAMAASMMGTATPEQRSQLEQLAARLDAQEAAKLADPRVARNRRKAAIRKAKNAATSKEERRAAAKGMTVDALEAQRRAREANAPQRTRSAVREMKRRQKRAIRQMETRYRTEVRGKTEQVVMVDEVQNSK